MEGPHYKPFESPANPYPLIARDLAEYPVVFDPSTGHYQVSSHRAITEVLLHPEIYSSGVVTAGERNEGPSAVVMLDPPAHGRQRRLLSAAFSRRRVQALKPRIEDVVHGLIEGLPANGRFDLTSSIGYPLPITIIAEMLGIPVEDREHFRRWTLAIERLAQAVPQEDDLKLAGELRAYLLDQIHIRRVASGPSDDLIAAMVQAEVEGERLSDDEIANNASFLLVAGNSTTTDALGNLVFLLETHPGEKVKLLEDLPARAPNAIEEGLRYDGPVHALFRTALMDTQLEGVEIPEGSRLMVIYGAASHDPDVFDEPDRFRIDRDFGRSSHLAFGWGIHLCLGMKLARLELLCALQALYARLPNLRLIDGFTPVQGRGPILRGWEKLDMQFEPPILPRDALGSVAEIEH